MINDQKFLLVPSKVTFWGGRIKEISLSQTFAKDFHLLPLLLLRIAIEHGHNDLYKNKQGQRLKSLPQLRLFLFLRQSPASFVLNEDTTAPAG